MIGRRRQLVIFLTGLMICALPAGCSAPRPPLERFEYAQIIMGVEARITLYAEDEPAGRDGARAAFERMNALDAVMSDYRADSELMELCRAPAGTAVALSPDLMRVLQTSIDMSRETDGAFDVTIGPVVRLWREARRAGRLPDPAELDEARRLVGWRLIVLSPTRGTATLLEPGMRLDLGGIGKGFAVDEAIAALRAAGIDRCLVNLGGDLAAWKPPPGEDGWVVGIETGSQADPTRLSLKRAAVATSGDLEQFVEVDGVRYSHIVDPATGLGLTNQRAVTVVARYATTADALASALSVRKSVGGRALRELLARHNASARRVSPVSEWAWRFPWPGVLVE